MVVLTIVVDSFLADPYGTALKADGGLNDERG
jgi:hypothetical protein